MTDTLPERKVSVTVSGRKIITLQFTYVCQLSCANVAS